MPDAPRDSVHTSPPDHYVASVPVWVRIADVLVLTLIPVAVALACGGMIRLRIGAVRLSVSSAIETAIWALAIAAVRHWRVRRPSLPARAWAGIWRAWHDEALRAVVPVALATRLTVWALGLYGVFTFGFPPTSLPFRLDRDELINLPGRWDAGWYVSIARVGYSWDPIGTQQQNIAFFPAFPLMMRVIGQLLGGGTKAIAVAGLLISTVAFVWALAVLFRLTRERPAFGASEHAHAAVLLLAAYPFSVFYGAVYTESLFLLAVVSAFWHATHHRWAAAAAWGMFAGLVRPNGLLLAVPLGLIAVSQWRTARTSGAPRQSDLVWPLIAAGGPVAGMLLYSAYIYTLSGNPFQWAAIQSTWGRSFSGMAWLMSPLDYITRYGVLTYVRDAPADALNLVAALFVLAILVPVTRRLGLAYGSFVALNLLLPLTRGGVLSMGRLSSTLFPIFIWLALRIPESRRGLWIAGFAMGEGLLALLFYTWRPPY